MKKKPSSIVLFHLYLLLGIVLLGICSSCVSITGLTDGYDKLSSINKERVCYLRDSGGPGARSTGTIYLVSANELKKIIEQSDKQHQIVYEYNPNCPSDVCVPISTFVSLCKKYDAEPIILARYLDNALFDLSVGDIPRSLCDRLRGRGTFCCLSICYVVARCLPMDPDLASQTIPRPR